MTAPAAPAPASPPRTLRRGVLALPLAATWSLAYLGLGIAWLTGAPGNPADPAVDDLPDGQATLPWLGAGPGAWLLTGLAALGVLVAGAMVAARRAADPPPGARVPGGRARGPLLRLPAFVAAGLGLVLAVVIPDYRLIASVAYTPVVPVMRLLGQTHGDVEVWPWPSVNLLILTLAGLCWLAAAAAHQAAVDAGRPLPRWRTPQAAARWGRWAVAVAVAVPAGYALTRVAWAFGIPLGISQKMLDDLGSNVYAGAGLGLLALAGGGLTLGLVQRWGEVFPRWIPVLRGRRVPVRLALVPAYAVSVMTTSAGLMLTRLVLAGDFAVGDDTAADNLAAWLPLMFWPLWGAALAAAAYAYRLRRSAEAAGRPGGSPEP